MKLIQPLTAKQQALVEENLRLIHWTIQQYIDTDKTVCGLDYDDLYQEGALALCHAAATFEDRGAQFKSYAVMKKYGEAAVVEMIMSALPEIAKNVAEPLSKVDKITMYGEGNSAKLLADIVNGTTQVTEGISAGMGLDIKSLLAGALGGKLASDSAPQVVVVPQQTPSATGVTEGRFSVVEPEE